MEWLQVLSLFLANASLIVWFRAESRADLKHMDNKVDAIREDMKEFHARLLKQDKDFNERLLSQDFEFKSRLVKIEEGRK